MVETDLLLVSVKGPSLHDGVLHRKSGHILILRAGELGKRVDHRRLLPQDVLLFPFNRCMRHFICSANQEKLAVRTRFALGKCCALQPLSLAGGTRRRVGVVAHGNKNRNSVFRVNIAVTVRSTTAGWLVRLLLCLSRQVDGITQSQRC